MELAKRLNISLDYTVTDVLAVLYANRDKHIADYEKAVVNYQDKVRSLLNDLENAVIKAKEETSTANVNRVEEITRNISRLPVPKNCKEMYNSYISLISQSSSQTITLTTNDADCIFNDNWDFAVLAKSVFSTYAVN